jgi:hypothetical protein
MGSNFGNQIYLELSLRPQKQTLGIVEGWFSYEFFKPLSATCVG